MSADHTNAWLDGVLPNRFVDFSADWLSQRSKAVADYRTRTLTEGTFRRIRPRLTRALGAKGTHSVRPTFHGKLIESRQERKAMPTNEMVAEIRAAAASLITAAGAAENGDVAAAEIGIEDALFRTESLLSRIRQGNFSVEPPSTIATDKKLS